MSIRNSALLVVLMSALVAIAAACGGGDGDRAALERYFQSAKDLDVVYEEQFALFRQQLDAELAAAAAEEESLASLRNNFGENLAVFTVFVNGLDDLAAPDGVKDAHNMAIDALRVYLARLNEAEEQLADAGSIGEIEAVYADEDLDAANDQAVRTCIALQDIADENEIEIDIGCTD